MSLGNTKLVDYGIQSENSDLRAHVCVIGKKVYIYKTKAGLEQIGKNNYRKVQVKTNNIITAEGYLVPWNDISGIKSVKISPITLKHAGFTQEKHQMTSSEKGNSAVAVVKKLLKSGLFPIEVYAEKIDDEDMQISGTDILLKLKDCRIQVKCDWAAGEGGTGNLFLQTAECNPHKEY
jgi:hypothetical protein